MKKIIITIFIISIMFLLFVINVKINNDNKLLTKINITETFLRLKNNSEEISKYCNKMIHDKIPCERSSLCKFDEPCGTPDKNGNYCFAMGQGCIPK